MKNSVRVLSAVSGACLVGLTLAAGAQAPAGAPFVTHQLRPNVYWIEGGGGNSTVVIGDKGVVVIDAKVSKAGGQELLEDIARITPKPVDTVILTHSDGDHVNGLAAFPAGVKVIAQENNRKEQEAALAAGGPGAPSADHLPTEIISRQEQTETIDGVKFQLYHWAPAHTSGDLVVYLPAEKIVATGDIVATNNPYPRIHDEKHGSTEGWIVTAKGIVGLNADTFIPGHGDIQTKAQIQKRIADAVERRNQVKKLVAEGKSLPEIKDAVGDHDKLNYKSWTEVCYQEMAKK